MKYFCNKLEVGRGEVLKEKFRREKESDSETRLQLGL